MTAADLIAFEADIAAEFNAGHIRAPVHLYDGCEDQMIAAFKDVRTDDWVCCGWRSHYQCLLHGVPPAELKDRIMAGRSISLCFPRFRIVSSAMVGGILPIAMGIAHAIRSCGGRERVHCWMGDMTALGGTSVECINYSHNFKLPVRWIVEDNGQSVCTDTRMAWGLSTDPFLPVHNVQSYTYKSKYPHVGAGARVNF